MIVFDTIEAARPASTAAAAGAGEPGAQAPASESPCKTWPVYRDIVITATDDSHYITHGKVLHTLHGLMGAGAGAMAVSYPCLSWHRFSFGTIVRVFAKNLDTLDTLDEALTQSIPGADMTLRRAFFTPEVDTFVYCGRLRRHPQMTKRYHAVPISSQSTGQRFYLEMRFIECEGLPDANSWVWRARGGASYGLGHVLPIF